MELLTTKTKDEILEIVYAQRVHINKLTIDLETEKAQVQAIVEDVMPIINEIKESNKFLRFWKIVKLAFVLVEFFVKWGKQNKGGSNDAQ